MTSILAQLPGHFLCVLCMLSGAVRTVLGWPIDEFELFGTEVANDCVVAFLPLAGMVISCVNVRTIIDRDGLGVIHSQGFLSWHVQSRGQKWSVIRVDCGAKYYSVQM